MPFSPHASRLKLTYALYLLASSLPSLAAALQDGSSSNATSSSSSTSSLNGHESTFRLGPINALIFSLSIIFSIIASLQLLSAAFNIPKHVSNISLPFCSSKNVLPPFTLPTPTNTNPIPLYALGPIFPIALTFAASCLLLTYILRAIFWGVVLNKSNPGGPASFDSESLVTAWAVFSYLAQAFLAMSLFSFVCFRVRRLCYCTCRGKFHIIKRVFDMILVFTLFIMGIAYVGYRAHVISITKTSSGDNEGTAVWLSALQGDHISRLVQLKRANQVLLVLVALEVFVSAVVLYNHAGKYQSAADRKVAVYIGSVIAPLFLTYALYPLIAQEVLIAQGPSQNFGGICQVMDGDIVGPCPPTTITNLELGRVIVTCVTLSVIIWMLLVFSGASLVDALKGRSSMNGSPQEQFGGQMYVHTHGLTYKR